MPLGPHRAPVVTASTAVTSAVALACRPMDSPSRRATPVGRSREAAAVAPEVAHARRRSAEPRAGQLSSASRGQLPVGPGAVTSCRAQGTFPKTASSVVGRCSWQVRRGPSGAVTGLVGRTAPRLTKPRRHCTAPGARRQHRDHSTV